MMTIERRAHPLPHWGVVTALLGALALAVGQTPAPAAAASGIVEVSDNGVNFSSTYSGTLFDDLARLVPGDSQESVFYVRNASDQTGMLRITLGDVIFTDTDYADALTVSASTGLFAGAAATALAANPCWVLLEGPIIRPGQAVAVTARMALGELHGRAGQGASAQFTIGVALSDGAVGALPPTECGRTDVPIPVNPRQASSSRPGGSSAAPADTGATAERADPPADLPVLNLPGGIRIDPNTWHLYEELLVLVLIGSSILGGGWFAFLAWRRRRHDDEEEGDVVA